MRRIVHIVVRPTTRGDPVHHYEVAGIHLVSPVWNNSVITKLLLPIASCKLSALLVTCGQIEHGTTIVLRPTSIRSRERAK